MGDIKNVQNAEAVEKIKEIVKKVNLCLFCTPPQEGALFDTRPMGVQDVDDAGNLWFLSDKNSAKNREIKQDDTVQLLFADPGSSTFMTVNGTADVFYDRQKVEELWNPIAKAWFTEGKDDPSLSIIRVNASDAYYWDTKDGKFISLLKIAAAALTGKEMDGGRQGSIEP